jgi:hypothetical protein
MFAIDVGNGSSSDRRRGTVGSLDGEGGIRLCTLSTGGFDQNDSGCGMFAVDIGDGSSSDRRRGTVGSLDGEGGVRLCALITSGFH